MPHGNHQVNHEVTVRYLCGRGRISTSWEKGRCPCVYYVRKEKGKERGKRGKKSHICSYIQTVLTMSSPTPTCPLQSHSIFISHFANSSAEWHLAHHPLAFLATCLSMLCLHQHDPLLNISCGHFCV